MANRSTHPFSLGAGLSLFVVAWGFVYLFSQLSRDWQIALGTVVLIAAVLLFGGYRAHRSASGVDPFSD